MDLYTSLWDAVKVQVAMDAIAGDENALNRLQAVYGVYDWQGNKDYTETLCLAERLIALYAE